MQFNSYFFILVFVPVLTIAYFGCNRLNLTAGKLCLIIGSAAFYLYGGWKLAIILGVSILFNIIFAAAVSRAEKGKRILLALAVLANIGLLFYYKYFNFFLTSVNHLLKKEFSLKEIALPLGISFFTFQQIMYLVNVYRKEIEKVRLLDYLAYILYFPKLLMGPLAEPADLIAQFNNPQLKRVDWDHISYGIKLFSFGLFKKLILADTFAAAAAWGYANVDAATSMDLFLVMLCYTFEIYFDFSGYSDMAVGVSTMLNISLPINFDSPYKAVSIRDFWKRWHISLTAFLTKYVYIPLGGSRKGRLRTYANIMLVFLISGIWHGANWTFILWGALHGLLQIIDRIFDKAQKKLVETVRWSMTFLVVNLLWLLFRADSIAQWKTILVKMFTFQNMAVSDKLLQAFILPETAFLLRLFHLETLNSAVRGLSLLIFTTAAFGICLIPDNNYNKRESNNGITMVMAAVTFVWGFLCLSSESVFVYFNF